MMNKRQYFKNNKFTWNIQQTNEYFGFLESLALKNKDDLLDGYTMVDLKRKVSIEKYYSKSRRYWLRLLKDNK